MSCSTPRRKSPRRKSGFAVMVAGPVLAIALSAPAVAVEPERVPGFRDPMAPLHVTLPGAATARPASAVPGLLHPVDSLAPAVSLDRPRIGPLQITQFVRVRENDVKMIIVLPGRRNTFGSLDLEF